MRNTVDLPVGPGEEWRRSRVFAVVRKSSRDVGADAVADVAITPLAIHEDALRVLRALRIHGGIGLHDNALVEHLAVVAPAPRRLAREQVVVGARHAFGRHHLLAHLREGAPVGQLPIVIGQA